MAMLLVAFAREAFRSSLYFTVLGEKEAARKVVELADTEMNCTAMQGGASCNSAGQPRYLLFAYQGA